MSVRRETEQREAIDDGRAHSLRSLYRSLGFMSFAPQGGVSEAYFTSSHPFRYLQGRNGYEFRGSVSVRMGLSERPASSVTSIWPLYRLSLPGPYHLSDHCIWGLIIIYSLVYQGLELAVQFSSPPSVPTPLPPTRPEGPTRGEWDERNEKRIERQVIRAVLSPSSRICPLRSLFYIPFLTSVRGYTEGRSPGRTTMGRERERWIDMSLR